METVVIASTNPVKINAVKQAFAALFPKNKYVFQGVSVSTDIVNQPRSKGETLKGAHTRVLSARKLYGKADYWIGIEGGVEDTIDGMEAFAWVEIRSKEGKTGRGRTGTFMLPESVADIIRTGKELGEADDIVFNLKNSKKKQGAVGILTNSVITRTTYYRDAVILALIPFVNSALYPDPKR